MMADRFQFGATRGPVLSIGLLSADLLPSQLELERGPIGIEGRLEKRASCPLSSTDQPWGRSNSLNAGWVRRRARGESSGRPPLAGPS